LSKRLNRRERDFYRRELRNGLAYHGVNYDKPDYLEYEIVKGPSTYEVQMSFDKNSRKANKVDVPGTGAESTEKAKGEGGLPEENDDQSFTLQRARYDEVVKNERPGSRMR
jgi:hypothetical protein